MAGKRLVFLALALLAGCSRDKGTAAAGEGSNRDLQRPAMDASAPMNDNAAAQPARATSAPKSIAAKPVAKPATRMLATGTAIAAKFDAGISSRTHKAGQTLTGTVAADVKDKSGRTVIPAGSKVHITITAIHESENKSDKTGTLTLKPTAVSINGQSYPVMASIQHVDTKLEGRKTNAGDVAKPAAGAAVGAVVGRVLGGSTKGAVIGGVIGGAVGAQRAVETKDRDVVLPSGTTVTLVLDQTFKPGS